MIHYLFNHQIYNFSTFLGSGLCFRYFLFTHTNKPKLFSLLPSFPRYDIVTFPDISDNLPPTNGNSVRRLSNGPFCTLLYLPSLSEDATLFYRMESQKTFSTNFFTNEATIGRFRRFLARALTYKLSISFKNLGN